MTILASVGAFGDATFSATVVLNVLHFVDPSLCAVHTSRGAATLTNGSSDGTVRWPPLLEPYKLRLLANPVHLLVENDRVKRSAGNVLPIHLLNIAFLLRATAHRHNRDDRIVLLPGNAVLFRPCAPIIQSGPMSFTLGTAFSDLYGDQVRPSAGWPSNTSALWRLRREEAASRNDSAIRQDGYFKNLYRYFGSANSTLLAPSPLAYNSHEGSWYPAWFLREALARMRGTPFDPQLWVDDHGRCPIHNFAQAPRCTTEEMILPSMAWQHDDPTLMHAYGRPALVIRSFTWAFAQPHLTRTTVNKLDEYAAAIEEGAPANYCGYKLVHDGSNGHAATARLLRLATLRGRLGAKSSRAPPPS